MSVTTVNGLANVHIIQFLGILEWAYGFREFRKLTLFLSKFGIL